MTPRGYITAIAAVALVAAGFGWRSPGLLALGFAGLTIVVVAGMLIGRSARAALHVAHPPSRVPRLAPVTIGFQIQWVRRARFVWLFSGDVGAPSSVVAVSKRSSRVQLEPSTARRGFFELGPFLLVQSDPWSLFRRTAASAPSITLTVQPQVFPMSGQLRALNSQLSQLLDSQQRGDEHFAAVREYVIGDDPRTIHWRSSARVGELVVRESIAAATRSITLVLDVDVSAYWQDSFSTDPGDELFEQTVDLTASICSAMATHGDVYFSTTAIGASVTGGSRQPLPLIMDALTVVQRVPPLNTAPRDLLATIRSTGAALVILVSGAAGHRTLEAMTIAAGGKSKLAYVPTLNTARRSPVGVRTIAFDLESGLM